MNQRFTNPRCLFFASLNIALLGSLNAQAGFTGSNALEAQAYVAIINQGHTALSSASGFALVSLSSGSGVHGGYAFDNVETDPTGSDREFDADITQHSANFGYVHQFDKFVAGLSLSYIDSEVETNYADIVGNTGVVDFDADGWVASAAVADTWGQVTLSVIAGFGQLSADGSRRNTNPMTPFQESPSSFDMDLYYVTIDGNYDIVVSQRMTVAPFVQFNYLNVSSDSFAESDGNTAGKADSIDRDWITSELGLRSLFDVSDTLTAFLVLSWEYDFDSSETEISGSDILGNFGSRDIPDVGESRLKAIVGFDYSISENWALSADLSFASGDDYEAFGAGSTLSYTF